MSIYDIFLNTHTERRPWMTLLKEQRETSLVKGNKQSKRREREVYK